jgi:hypothetical protein
MRAQTLRALAVFAFVLTLPVMASAQFGHPLKGQWSGDSGSGATVNRMLLDLQWDGKEITGAINPGTDTAAAVKKVTFDYSNVDAWKVQIEAEGKDASGKIIPVRLDATLENLGAYRKHLHGTLIQGGQKTPFSLTRN